ncbi:MAG: YdcH family protein [Yoonia sp.]|uniref:YdcH family protein n=1 Tax=Yoonia sp. TaxID=2212373 RepID=UPI00273D96C4|nr:YdcH family protein [Yoonia sp.]MDP5084594.1 YdcH family protein [Yoonia sp.]MDP5359685.1 YdcH family protein [Paracoccaceae bacterium]MDP5362482.1 YdcH family protein [Paracoccaceae bacterium]
MTHTPHELIEEFHDQVDLMHALKLKDSHFAKMYDAYHVINKAIHRAETDLEPTDDMHLIEMRKQRLALKDEIASALRAG